MENENKSTLRLQDGVGMGKMNAYRWFFDDKEILEVPRKSDFAAGS